MTFSHGPALTIIEPQEWDPLGLCVPLNADGVVLDDEFIGMVARAQSPESTSEDLRETIHFAAALLAHPLTDAESPEASLHFRDDEHRIWIIGMILEAKSSAGHRLRTQAYRA